ncbi:MAG: PQQ-binding-like beta-propeller repeat protein [Candidatus Micrarchaeota archaeon]|nr:PQQ-binding-like beta-propeller repeat protein [Candidatus Micrarchaeota archaeon]
MSRYLVLIAALLLCLNLPSSKIFWSYQTGEKIESKGVIIGENVIFASTGGRIYALNAEVGSLAWSYSGEDKFTFELQAFDQNSIAALTAKGKLLVISADTGRRRLEKNLAEPPTSFAVGDGKVFVGYKKKLAAYDIQGNTLWETSFDDKIGPILFNEGSLYFTSGRKIYSVGADAGNVKWSVLAENSFLSRPVARLGSIYVAGSDGKIYSLDSFTGRVRWVYSTGGWIISTPLLKDDTLYFSSTDGYFYSLSASANLRYKTYIGAAAWSQPQFLKGDMVFSADDGKIYGIDAESGQIKWSFSSQERPGAVLVNKGRVLFGTAGGKIYSLGRSPICSFDWPPPQQVVGNWPVEIEGRASSESPIERVEVRVQGENWVAAQGKENWSVVVDFEKLPVGPVQVECRAYDVAGNSETGDYAYTMFIKMNEVPLRKMYVVAPYEVDAGRNFTISVVDERGKDLRGLEVSIEGRKISGESPLNLSISSPGPVTVLIRKPGFEELNIIINAKGGLEWGLIAIVLVFFLVVIAAVYLLFLRKKRQ